MSSHFSKKIAAQELYTERNWSTEDIIELLNIEEAKLNEWIHRERWDKKKAVFQTSDKNILKLEQEAFEKFLKDHKNTNDYKTLLEGIKLFTDSIERAKEGDTTPAAAQEVMVAFAKYMSKELEKDQKIGYQTLLDFQNSFLELHYGI